MDAAPAAYRDVLAAAPKGLFLRWRTRSGFNYSQNYDRDQQQRRDLVEDAQPAL
jgi:hypothetical protein